ncbi:MAG: thiamine phosphate synthase [Bosea sp. (in: a-proteobacteria)]
MMKIDISVYGILDPQVAQGRKLGDLARAAATSGATLIQYRAKDSTTRQMILDAAEIHLALVGTGVPLLINDRVDVALAMGAEGVHLGHDDMPFDVARKLLGEHLGPAAIIGATVKNEAHLAAIPPEAVSYLCIGGVYATRHKDNPDPPVGIDGFARLRAAARVRFGTMQVGAIAGIDAGNLAPLITAGADGVAVIGAVFGGADVAASTRKLAQSVAAARGEASRS